MAMRRMTLDGPWRMAWAEYGARRDVLRRPEFDDAAWLQADVPGDAHLDLLRAGRIPDPFVGIGTDACLWMEQKDWWYRTRFAVPADWPAGPGRAVRLLFHGLDGFATVYLDGEPVADHANMFRPLEVDVTGRLTPGREHVLAVRLATPLFAPLERPPRQETPWGHPRQLSRKAQMSYGWDIAPRLVTIGLWQPVELVAIDAARLRDAAVRTRALVAPRGQGAAAAEMEAVVAVEALPGAAGPLTVHLEAAGRTMTAAVPAGAAAEVRFDWSVDDPPLWWPYGSGEAVLLRTLLLPAAPRASRWGASETWKRASDGCAAGQLSP